jgi:hypothetical protein
MSANNIIIKSAFAVVATAGLTLTAYAGNNSSRYGGPSVYDYESGGQCSSAACAQGAYAGGRYGASHGGQHTQTAPTVSRYGGTCGASMGNNCVQPQPYSYQQSMPVSPGVVYVDCATMGTCAPQQSVQTYQAPTTSYAQSYSTQSYSAPMAQAADCPAGTTMQSDGTCMQSSYSSTPSYSSATTYSSTSSYGGETVPCPAGTSKQSDGSCMQTGSSFGSSTSYSGGSSYSSASSYGSSSAPANCPAGTTAQSDGTCMQGGSVSSYAGGTATIYSGDATTSTSTYGGYTSDGSYTANSYLPIRK